MAWASGRVNPNPGRLQRIPGKCGTVTQIYQRQKMKPYATEFREKIVKAYERGNTSIRKVAARFDVSKAFVQKLLKQKQTIGNVQPKKQGGSIKSVLSARTTQLIEMVEKYPDLSLSEYCEYWLDNYNEAISPSMMCRELNKQNLTRKKRQYEAVKQLQNECNY
jgi:transposase